MSRVVTLTTDLGSSDAYVAAMKGVILTINPEANVVDITHSIEPQDIHQGAFILNTAYRYFPEHSIHIAIVDPGVGSNRKPIILKTPLALFVAPDNGILSYVISDLAQNRGSSTEHAPDLEQVSLKKGLEAIAITDPRFWRNPISTTFHGRDIFAPVAAGISLDISPYEFGDKVSFLNVFPVSRPFSDAQGNLIGHILHVDHFGNLIADIRKSDLPGKADDLVIEIAGYRIRGLSSYYAQQEEGLMAVLGSNGYLEIALRDGNARNFLEIGVGDEIMVRAGSS
jgi:S-adenosyl-L-methionine hydrolase (adenosine-forming)